MALIEVLPEHVVDQIAAGEVIERPASAVKELLDNALDAGATQISVEIAEGGRALIRVVDNGVGMAPAQLPKAILRHATSKLRRFADLDGLSTMGFRGEALATIAAVSHCTIVSRTANEAAATKLSMVPGGVPALTPAAGPLGTTVTMEALFANLPARAKFLKSVATEAAHIQDAVVRAALAHPAVHFRCIQDSRSTLDCPPAESVVARAKQLLGDRLGPGLLVARHQQDQVDVVALLGSPELAQTTARGAHLFVNRRAVKDRGLLHAISMAYGELLPKGKYPVAVLFVTLPSPLVDYNVHPQKSEVRFADSSVVQAAVRHGLRVAIAKAPWLGHDGGSTTVLQSISTLPPVARLGDGSLAQPNASGASALARSYAKSLALPRSASRARDAAMAAPRLPLGPTRDWRADAQASPTATTPSSAMTHDQRGDTAPRLPAPPGRALAPDASIAVAAHGSQPEHAARAVSAAANPSVDEGLDDSQPAGFFGALRYIGQLDLTYLVCENEGELVLIDQHAAHERVAFAALKASAQKREIASQRMLLPVVVTVTPAQQAMAVESGEVLRRIGFGVTPEGATTLAIVEVPTELRGGAPATLLVELLDEWIAKGGSRAVEQRLDLALATVACHSVVRAGDRLSDSEAQALLHSLDRVDFRSYCPHGRPALLRIPIDELARRFGR